MCGFRKLASFWVKGRNPLQQHRIESPDCRYITGDCKENVPFHTQEQRKNKLSYLEPNSSGNRPAAPSQGTGYPGRLVADGIPAAGPPSNQVTTPTVTQESNSCSIEPRPRNQLTPPQNQQSGSEVVQSLLVERVEGCQLDSIRSTVAMELYLGSIIEPIRKSIRNTLYFNSKHAPKTLGEAMQKVQDLHIKHLYVIGEDQESGANDMLPEITVNEVTSGEDRGWYRNKRDFREHSQNSREMSPQKREYSKKVMFNQPSETKTTNGSEYRESSQNLRVPSTYSKEHESDKPSQQPSVILGSFTQIMVNPMQLQDHKFTASLDRLVEARKN